MLLYEFQRTLEEAADDRARAKPVATMRVHSKACGDARIRPLRVVVKQKEYQHDVAVVIAVFDEELSRRVKPKCPLTIRWGRRGLGRGRFHGYVHSIEPWKNSSQRKLPRGQRRVKIVCKASSTRLRIRDSKLWKNITTGKIVQRISRLHFFSADIPVESRTWRRIQQKPKETTWDFLVRIAKRSKCTLYARNMRLVLYPRGNPPLIMWLEARLFRTERREISNLEITDATEVGGHDDEQSETDGQTVDPRKIKVVKLVKLVKPKQPKTRGRRNDPCLPIVNLYKAPRRVVTWVDAPATENRDELEEEVEPTELYPVRATVRLAGDSAVHQGGLVRLRGIGPRDDGLWYVISAQHLVTPHQYVIDAELGRRERAPLEEPVMPPDPTLIDESEGEVDYGTSDEVVWDDERPIYDPTKPPPDEEPVIAWPLPEEDTEDLPLPDGDVPEDDDIVVDPGLQTEIVLRGPTCPVQPRPFQNGEWRSPSVGPNSVRILV